MSFGNSWRIGGRKCSEDFADYDADGFGRARGGLAQQVLELDENLSIGFRFGEGTDVAVATVDVARWPKAGVPDGGVSAVEGQADIDVP